MALKRATKSRPLAGHDLSKRVGWRNSSDELEHVIGHEVAFCADLGGSSKYSSANLEN